MALSELAEEELSAIKAIYSEMLIRLSESRILIKIPQFEDISVQLSFPPSYPASVPPNVLDVSVRKEKESYYKKKHLLNLFNQVMQSVFHSGSVCIFDFLTELDAILHEEQKNVSNQVDFEPVKNSMTFSSDPLDDWVASDPIVDRGSTFIAFAAHVKSEAEVFSKIDSLRTNNKFKKAAHLIQAWRIQSPGGFVYQDCDDDGETAAGRRILHLITMMGVWNILVVVARWFCGTHIGPDRFKHINSATREAVIRGNFVLDRKFTMPSKQKKSTQHQ